MEGVKIYFYSEEEKEFILEEYKLFTLVEVAYIGGNEGYIIFETDKNILKSISLQSERLMSLEIENQTLKKELVQMQASIASLMATTLEEK